MPVCFLSAVEHERLNRCPDDISLADLDTFFQLNTLDRTVIRALRGAANRLGFALQLGCLRYLGFFPNNFQQLDSRIVTYMAEQTATSAEAFKDYRKPQSTLYEHQHKILIHLNYRRITPMDVLALEQWLAARALEHHQAKHIFQLACNYLKQQRILRIGTTRLEQYISHAREQAEKSIYQQLQGIMTPEQQAWLDTLLVPEEAKQGRSFFTWLQRTPQSNTVRSIVDTLDKLALLYQAGISRWDMSSIHPNRRKWLAKRAKRSRIDNLRKLRPEVRYPVLLAFVEEALYTFSDALIEMVDTRLWDIHRDCRNQFKKDHLHASKAISQTLAFLKQVGQAWLEQDNIVLQAVDLEQLRTALQQASTFIRPEHDAYVDYFAKKYPSVCKFSQRLLQVMHFQSQGNDAGLLEGLTLISEIHAGTRRKLPTNAPTAFIPEAWQAEVFVDMEGIPLLNWRSYELAALWTLRDKLRSGDIYIQHSRRYLQLESYLIPPKQWQQQRYDISNLLNLSNDATVHVTQRYKRLSHWATKVDTLLLDAKELRWDSTRMVLKPLQQAEVSESLTALNQHISQRLVPCDITDILIAVDNWTGFSHHFHHLDGVSSRDTTLLIQLYTCLLAQACNLGFKAMADATAIPYRKLLWCNRWYLRDETLNAAITTLVNYHHSLPLTKQWGSGVLSSSDGQRFPVRGKVRQARALPRYFGYGQGITSYTWTSDQFSQFGSKIIPVTMREVTYVLDALLDNESDLDISEHTTDTSGFTEIIFALFSLLGYTFSPRIKDVADQKLYRPHTLELANLPLLRPALKQRIHEQRIIQGWDEMLRVVMSLKKGYCTASTLLQKLQAYPRKHPVARSLQEYGRLEKTIHILR